MMTMSSNRWHHFGRYRGITLGQSIGYALAASGVLALAWAIGEMWGRIAGR
jgi:hypothetical protein